MWLRAREDMSARIEALEMEVGFEPGEQMRTEISCKFTRDSLEREYRAAGLELVALVHGPGRPVRPLPDRPARPDPPAALPGSRPVAPRMPTARSA